MFRDSGRFDVQVVYLAIERAGVLVGEVDARRVGSLPSAAVEVGIELYDEAMRGKGLGGEAFELLVSHLFESESAERVEASTATGNAAMRRILDKIGFTCAGGSTSRAEYVLTQREWQQQRGD
jgi:RimJ/RimL family protein N-acetyltransferase